jgi:hypothetical protein
MGGRWWCGIWINAKLVGEGRVSLHGLRERVVLERRIKHRACSPGLVKPFRRPKGEYHPSWYQLSLLNFPLACGLSDHSGGGKRRLGIRLHQRKDARRDRPEAYVGGQSRADTTFDRFAVNNKSDYLAHFRHVALVNIHTRFVVSVLAANLCNLASTDSDVDSPIM